MYNFSDQVAVVTGGAGNLGQAVVRAFHAAGARVAVVVRKPQDAVEVFGEDLPESDTCAYFAADLADEGSVTAVARDIARRFGRIDILVNTAGGIRAGTPIHETPVDVWDFMMGLNARTVFLASRAVIPHMLERRSGRIISVSARAALKGSARHGAYNASKMAVIRLTETMAAELRHLGITVDGAIPSSFTRCKRKSRTSRSPSLSGERP